MKTIRGKFRRIKMDDINIWADNPMWDNEVSSGIYLRPLQLSAKVAYEQGKKLTENIPENELYWLSHYLCAESPSSHRAAFKNAIDFLVLDGTEVLASASGIVTEIQESSDKWGDDIKYRDYLNYVTIQHANGEFSQYCHLLQWSVRESGILIGSQVEQGQVIAKVGKTGLTDRDHLHFIVFRGFRNESPFQFKSLVPQFE